jgi:hypothetical protein
MYFVLVLSQIFLSQFAMAACTSPTGNAGDLTWTASKIKWCDGTTWKDTTNSTGSSCTGTTAGTINYSAGTLYYCNGTNWISMKGASAGSCSGTTAGSFTYNSGAVKYRFCDGTNWYNMEGGSLDCTAPWGATVTNGSSVFAFENTFYCTEIDGPCFSHRQTRTCTAGVLSGSFANESCDSFCCSC